MRSERFKPKIKIIFVNFITKRKPVLAINYLTEAMFSSIFVNPIVRHIDVFLFIRNI